MRIRTLVALFFLFICFACSKNSPEAPNPESESPIEEIPKEEQKEAYFTINIADDGFPEEEENWIVIHDLNGNIMDYSFIENAASYNFEKKLSELKNTFNVSLINIRSETGNTYHYLSTYTNIDKGSTWNLIDREIAASTPLPTAVGAITINATNLISPASFTLSTKNGYYNSVTSNTTTANGLTNMTFDLVPLYDEKTYLFSMYDIYGNGTYLFLENLYDRQNVTFDKTQMLAYDQTVPVYFPEGGDFFSLIFGFEEGQQYNERGGYLMNFFLPSDGEKLISNLVNLGYLNSLNKYRTMINYTNGKFNYRYQKFGDIPTGITIGNIEDWNVDVLNGSMNNFQYSGPSYNTYSRSRFSWETTNGTRDIDYVRTVWLVNQGRSAYSFPGELPEEILNTNPTLNTSNLLYSGAVFFLEEFSYQEFINDNFEQPNPNVSLDYEYYWILN